MTNSRRVTRMGILSFGVLVLATTSWAQTRPQIVEQLAKTYGYDSFGQIEAIRYTFNLDLGALKLSRTWVWEPKTDQVSYEGKDKAGKPVKATYVRSQISSAPANVKDEIDPAFNNDNYWLIFPFHVYWDTSAAVKYPSGGYTPGDTWNLYVGTDNRVRELFYRRGGPKKPSVVITTWADYKKAGPLLVSIDHRGTADGKPVRIFFSDVAVKLVGSNNWENVQ